MSARLVPALLVLHACSAPAPSTPDSGSCVEAFTPGTTDTPDAGFVAFVEGQDIGVYAGPQGGFHVFVGVETSGLPRMGTLNWRLHSTAGVELAARTLDVSALLLDDVPCGWARRRDVLIFTRTEEVPQYRDMPAQLALTLDVAGAAPRTWSARVVPR
ncbi:MAG: hypothetical protein Q8L14_42500 [Myxococcales bacterium]|nr:hypothetical protein [Myxococcales bacterium]